MKGDQHLLTSLKDLEFPVLYLPYPAKPLLQLEPLASQVMRNKFCPMNGKSSLMD